MTSARRPWRNRLGLLLGAATALAGMSNRTLGQSVAIYLPPTHGATALSTIIDAQARHLVSEGLYLESEARARYKNAEAASLEMQNSVQWVHTYFERRAINKAYRAKENPSYMEKVDRRYTVEEQRILGQAYDLTKGDLTAHLNWLLDALATTAVGRTLSPGNAEEFKYIDEPLDKNDLQQIILTESSGQNGRRLSFRAGEGKILATRWPFILRDPQFEKDREQVTAARDAALVALRNNGELSWSDATALQEAVDGLSASYLRYYGGDRYEPGWYRKMAQFQDFLAGKRYLESLKLAVGRLILLSEGDALSIATRFEGDSMIKLVNFMCQRGLQFARPEPGGEATYKKLFYSMRYAYIQLVADQRKNSSSYSSTPSP